MVDWMRLLIVYLQRGVTSEAVGGLASRRMFDRRATAKESAARYHYDKRCDIYDVWRGHPLDERSTTSYKKAINDERCFNDYSITNA